MIRLLRAIRHEVMLQRVLRQERRLRHHYQQVVRHG